MSTSARSLRSTSDSKQAFETSSSKCTKNSAIERLAYEKAKNFHLEVGIGLSRGVVLLEKLVTDRISLSVMPVGHPITLSRGRMTDLNSA